MSSLIIVNIMYIAWLRIFFKLFNLILCHEKKDQTTENGGEH